MKTLATSDPQRATELLQQAPQLAYAVFQALLLMGLVSPEAIQSVVEPGAPPPAQAPPVGYPSGPMPGYPGQTTTPPVAGMPYQGQQQQAYGAPPATPAAALAPAGQDPEQLVKAVMELSQAQIDMLSDADRAQIMALRAQFAGQQRR